MGALCSMRNIGKEMERKLNAIGIFTPEELLKAGGKDAFYRLKTRFPNICLVHLYTLQAAIDNIDLNQLPVSVKAELKKYNDSIK